MSTDPWPIFEQICVIVQGEKAFMSDLGDGFIRYWASASHILLLSWQHGSSYHPSALHMLLGQSCTAPKL